MSLENAQKLPEVVLIKHISGLLASMIFLKMTIEDNIAMYDKPAISKH